MRRHRISCFVITYNEADRIERCLKPLATWVDQLVVLDSGSTDGTADLARQFTPDVHVTDWPGFGKQRNRALALCEHEWVLNVDADEEVTDALKDEIDTLLSSDTVDFTLVKIPWRTVLFGGELTRGRYSSPQGKLFLKAGAAFKDRPIHETLLLPQEKPVITRQGLLHYSWRSFYHLQEKHLMYAQLMAQQKFRQGKRSSVGYAVLRLFVDFFQQYFLRLGLLDGWRGLVMAVVLGVYGFNKYAALAVLTKEHQSMSAGRD